VTTFALLVLVSVGRIIWHYGLGRGFDVNVALLCAASLLGAVISCWRVTTRGEEFARAVYDVFLANAGTAQ
jgi:hypothetical protein